MPNLARVCFALICFIMSWMTWATIYTWVDESGVVNYSDQPRTDANVVNLSTENKLPSQNAPPKTPLTSPEIKADSEVSEKAASIEIIDPKHDDTIRNPQGTVLMHLNVTPSFNKKDKIQIILDNIPTGEPRHSNIFTLTGVMRGTHTLTAQLVDDHGTVKAESKKITIHMMQPRVNMVPHKNVL